MNIQYFLWLLPFITFFLGYQSIKFFMRENSLETPSVIGLSLGPALELLSSVSLNPKILAYKEDDGLPAGTVISQSPGKSQKVKPHQSIFLVITRQSISQESPDFIGQNCDMIKEKSLELGINNNIYFFESEKSVNSCIAQDRNNKIIYCSSGETPVRIFPNLKNHNLKEVVSFLQDYNFKVQIKYIDYLNQIKDINNKNYIVIKQKPEALEFINIKKPAIVKLVAKLAV